MEVTPRLVAKRVSIPQEKEIRRDDSREDKPEKFDKPDKFEKPEKPEDEESKSVFGGITILVVIFASIIVLLILVVVWIITRADKVVPWKWGAAKSPPPKPDPPAKSAHSDLVASAHADELAMYANPEPRKVEKVEKVEKEQEQVVVDIDDEIAADLDRIKTQLDKPATLDEVIDAEAAKMDASKFREIEQVNKKTKVVMNSYLTSESVTNANFDMAIVTQCCLGEKPTHKGYIWRYREDVTEPPE